MIDNIKQGLAEQLGKALQAAYSDKIADVYSAFDIDESSLTSFIYSKLEIPKDAKMGDYAIPAFFLSKVLKEKPVDIAQRIFEQIDSEFFNITGPYINARILPVYLAELILPDIFQNGDQYGSQDIGKGKNVAIDFSSPNIAKPFGVGHLRSTAIGNSLYRIYEKLGYNCIGINHLGDWGTQFGRMIVAWKKWGNQAELEKDPIKHLYSLYVKFHDEEAHDSALADEGKSWFKKLEAGDEEATKLWNLFKDYSLKEFKRIYDLLDVHFDHYTGESFYQNLTDGAIDRLTKAGLTSESEGALVVNLDDYDMPPCLLRKADGATLYATRDLAGLFYRYEQFKFDKALYVVGSAQAVHFKQIFKVVELLGEPYHESLKHVEFGWIRFADQAMSTRKGNIIFLEDLIETAKEKVAAIIKEKNPNLANLDQTALDVALGAIIFSDLSVKKHKDVNFSWEEALSFEGETGPYLQYTHARLSSLLRRYNQDVTADVDFSLLDSPEEKAILMHLYRFGLTIEHAADKYEPNLMIEYLIELTAVFNRFYQRKDSKGKVIKIVDSDKPSETSARMLLVLAIKTVLKEGLRLVGIKAPEEM